MKKSLFLLWLLCPGLLLAQNAEEKAIGHIKKLKEGVLLVRLRTKEPELKLLRKERLFDRMHRIQAEVRKDNMEVVRGFRKAFNFCEVQFYFSTHSKQVAGGDYEGVFLTDSLTPKNTVILQGKPIYLADVGDINFETFGSHMKGAMVYDSTFTPLGRPFPYYVRKLEGTLLMKRSNEELIHLLNKRLHSYYNMEGQ